MYVEVYVFYVALTGLIILLSYKAYITYQYDQANKNHIWFDPFPKTRLKVLLGFHKAVVFTKEKIMKPLGRSLWCNFILVRRGFFRFVEDVRYGNRKLGTMIKKSGIASLYIQKVLEQKKKIRKRAKNHL
ncbi:MAG: hypothetical protein KAR24_02200 [Candidatus Pacebacteria bacterium]|nr:hypothetical protein [Candidatus Paceibacterota bacterium]